MTIEVVREIVMVPVDSLHPNESNPNEQDDRTFNALCEAIQEEGFLDPIAAVQREDGEWDITGGEHRWRAAKVLEMPEVPVTPLDPDKFDKDRQDWNLVKLNVLNGDLNPEKFTKLYQRLVKTYDEETMKTLMGFTTEDAFRKVYKEVKRGLPPELADALDEAKGEIKTIDDLSIVLNRLFSEFGETLPSNMMVFSWGGREVLWIRCDDAAWKVVEPLARKTAEAKGDFAALVAMALTEQEETVDA